MELVLPELRVTISETTMPAALENVSGSVTGPKGAPSALDVQWDAVASDADVYTNIAINHHAAQGTFTECQVATSAGALHIDGDMMVPLSVSTGLEFRGIEHVRFAAAKTDDVCIEFRFSSNKQFL